MDNDYDNRDNNDDNDDNDNNNNNDGNLTNLKYLACFSAGTLNWTAISTHADWNSAAVTSPLPGRGREEEKTVLILWEEEEETDHCLEEGGEDCVDPMGGGREI